MYVAMLWAFVKVRFRIFEVTPYSKLNGCAAVYEPHGYPARYSLHYLFLVPCLFSAI